MTEEMSTAVLLLLEMLLCFLTPVASFLMALLGRGQINLTLRRAAPLPPRGA